MDKISALSLVPFVQGVMRYLYKTKSVASAKEAGELWAFATAALQFVNECSLSWRYFRHLYLIVDYKS
jgi:hypothetical protein